MGIGNGIGIGIGNGPWAAGLGGHGGGCGGKIADRGGSVIPAENRGRVCGREWKSAAVWGSQIRIYSGFGIANANLQRFGDHSCESAAGFGITSTNF